MSDLNIDKIFFDTNIIIYLYSFTEVKKSQISRSLLDSPYQLIISTQVLNEFSSAMNKKSKLNFLDIKKLTNQISEIFQISIIKLETIDKALSLADKYKFSYFDSLMISSALENNCTIFYSEDLHHNQIIENSLRIINPFLDNY